MYRPQPQDTDPLEAACAPRTMACLDPEAVGLVPDGCDADRRSRALLSPEQGQAAEGEDKASHQSMLPVIFAVK